MDGELVLRDSVISELQHQPGPAPADPAARAGSGAGQLEAADVVDYLLGRGELEPCDLVHSDFSVEVVDRKNVSFVVHVDGPRLLLKRPRDPRDPGVANEAAVYVALRQGAHDRGGDDTGAHGPGVAAHDRGVAAHLPAFHFFDPDRQVLALEYLPDAPTLRDHHERTGRSPAHIGRATGRVLAALHAMPFGSQWLAAGEPPPPWALTLLEPPISVLETESSGTLAVLRRIQGSQPLTSAAEGLLERWEAKSLCHNDVRLDNVLRLGRSGGGGARIVLVDWELCSPGDGLWDVAGLLAGYVELWATHALTASRLGRPAAARHSLAAFRPLLRAFWAGYLSASDGLATEGRASDGLATDGRPPWGPDTAVRVTSMIGLRLAQTALEYSQGSNEATADSLALLTLAEQFAQRPLERWVHALGLPLGPLSGPIHA
ncbi:MAG: phosphotransferase [Candidatus Nanopelagicales bacterium]